MVYSKLTENEGGREDHKNLTEPRGGDKIYFNVTQPKSSKDRLFGQRYHRLRSNAKSYAVRTATPRKTSIKS